MCLVSSQTPPDTKEKLILCGFCPPFQIFAPMQMKWKTNKKGFATLRPLPSGTFRSEAKRRASGQTLYLKKVNCRPYIQGLRVRLGYSPKGGTILVNVIARKTKLAGNTIYQSGEQGKGQSCRTIATRLPCAQWLSFHIQYIETVYSILSIFVKVQEVLNENTRRE